MQKLTEALSLLLIFTGVLITSPIILFCCFVILLFSLFFAVFLIAAVAINPALVEEQTNIKKTKADDT